MIRIYLQIFKWEKWKLIVASFPTKLSIIKSYKKPIAKFVEKRHSR